MAKITQSLVAHEGKYIVMPPHKEDQEGWANMNRPDVHEAGGDTTQLYPVNCKFVDFDRTFIYGYCEGIVASKANVGLFNHNVEESISKSSVAGAVGDTTVALLTPVTDETAAAINIFAGGYFMSRTNPYSGYRVVSNTVYNGGAVGTSEMDIVIEDPGLGAIITASQGTCKLNRNPYTGLYGRWGGANNFETVMGVSLILSVAATYQWVQTWGPCHIGGDEAAGKTAYYRLATFAGDGSILCSDDRRQIAGEILGNTVAATYSWFIQLRLER